MPINGGIDNSRCVISFQCPLTPMPLGFTQQMRTDILKMSFKVSVLLVSYSKAS